MALVGGAYTGYLVVRDAEYFRLRHVHIMGNETLTRQDVHYLLALPTPVTLFQLDLTRMGDRLERHPYVKTVALRRQFPDTLTVTIRERVPSRDVFAGARGFARYRGRYPAGVFSRARSGLAAHVLRQHRVLAPGIHLRHEEVQRALELVRA